MMIQDPQTDSATVEQIEIADIATLIGIADRCGLSSWSPRNFVDELSRPDSIMLRLNLSGIGIVGFIVGRIVKVGPPEPIIEAEIYNIGVDERFQRRGFGQMLFDAFLERCSDAGVSQIWLEVRVTNKKAIAFYEQNGFVKYSVRKGFYTHPTEDGLTMCRKAEKSGKSGKIELDN